MDLENLSEIISNNWLTLVVGIGSSAAGAFAAQYIISRRQDIEYAISTINICNSAASLATSICQSLINLKKQHFLDLHSGYLNDRQRLVNMIEGRDRSVRFAFKANLLSIALPKLPLNVLETYVFERLSLRARALLLSADLSAAIDQLGAMLQLRNSLIEEYRQDKNPDESQISKKYFGIVDKNGNTDTRMFDVIDGIGISLDSSIYFSHQLYFELIRHGNDVLARHRGMKLPPLINVDWKKSHALGLIPTKDDFSGWESAFSEPQPRGMQRIGLWFRRNMMLLYFRSRGRI